MSAYKVLERYRVVKGGSEYRWRVGDIWEVISYPFEEERGDTHLCRNRTSFLNGTSMARRNLRSGHFERIEEGEG